MDKTAKNMCKEERCVPRCPVRRLFPLTAGFLPSTHQRHMLKSQDIS